MSKLILIIDNDKQTLMVLQRLLFEEGYQTITASDGWEGINLVKIQKLDLIIMDLILPNDEGLVACNIIKTDMATRKIPLVIFTDMDSELSRNVAQELGADRYVNKRFGRDNLLDAICQLL